MLLKAYLTSPNISGSMAETRNSTVGTFENGLPFQVAQDPVNTDLGSIVVRGP